MNNPEYHFEDYLKNINEKDLHKNITKSINKWSNNIEDLNNIIFYGPTGVGKYTNALKVVKKYSPSLLKYEKKVSINTTKGLFILKISDIHYEIDMSLLGCNSKQLWHETYLHILDVISAKGMREGIILCKNFQEIHSELLEIFYSYMQTNFNPIKIKFFILTEEISFIPDNIRKCCQIISIPRPSRLLYNKCLNLKLDKNYKLSEISNLKKVELNVESLNSSKNISEKIVEYLLNNEDIKFLKFRDILYDLFINNMSVPHCIWYILEILIENKHLKEEDMGEIMEKLYQFFQFYNNNYRPIYHLESFMFFLITKIHGFK